MAWKCWFLTHLTFLLIGELIVQPGIHHQHFQTSCPLKSLGHLKPNFMWNLCGPGELKFNSRDLGHMTKMATTPICNKSSLKNLLLQSQWADCNWTWYEAFGALVYLSWFKLWPCVDLDLFYDKVKFGRLGFCTGKKWKFFISSPEPRALGELLAW